MNRAVFLDRDGTINRDISYCSRPEDFELLPSVPEGIRLLNQHGFKIVLITNQSGIARGYFTEEILAKIHEKMQIDLAKYGAHVDAIYYCPHHPDDNCDCRKPKPKMMLMAASDLDINLKESYLIGDSDTDIEMAIKVGCKAAIIIANTTSLANACLDSMKAAAEWIIKHECSKQ